MLHSGPAGLKKKRMKKITNQLSGEPKNTIAKIIITAFWLFWKPNPGLYREPHDYLPFSLWKKREKVEVICAADCASRATLLCFVNKIEIISSWGNSFMRLCVWPIYLCPVVIADSVQQVDCYLQRYLVPSLCLSFFHFHSVVPKNDVCNPNNHLRRISL